MLRTQGKRLFLGEKLPDIAFDTLRPTSKELLSDELSHGVTVTSGGGSHTKGSYVTLGTAAFDSDGFYVQAIPGTAARTYLFDIALGGAGSEVDILPNIGCVAPFGGNWMITEDFYVPLPVSAGTRISARCQAPNAGSDMWLSVQPVRGESLYPLRKSKATTYGAALASTLGTAVTTDGSTHTNGSWAQIDNSIVGGDYVIVSHATASVDTTTSLLLELGIGAAASEVVVVPGLQYRRHSALDFYTPGVRTRSVRLPTGARLAARARSSVGSASINAIVTVLS